MKWLILALLVVQVLGIFSVSAGPVPDTSYSTNANTNDDKDYYQSGMAAYNNKDWSKAITELSVAIMKDPTNVVAYLHRGEAYALSSDFDKAASDFSKVLQLDPANASAYFDSGNLYRAKRDLDRAIACFDECLRVSPTNDLAYKSRAATYVSKGEIQKGIEDWDRGLRLNANDANALAGRGWAYFMASDYAKATQDYETAIHLDTTNPLAYNGLAWLRATSPSAQIRKGKDAVKDATRACKLTKWAVWEDVDTLAAAYAEAGDFEQAVKYQKQALGADGIQEEKRSGMRRRLSLYERRQPFHDGQNQ